MITSFAGKPALLEEKQLPEPAGQDEPPGWPVVAQVSAETCDGEEGVVHGRRFGHLEVHKRAKNDDLTVRYHSARGRLRLHPVRGAQGEALAGDWDEYRRQSQE